MRYPDLFQGSKDPQTYLIKSGKKLKYGFANILTIQHNNK